MREKCNLLITAAAHPPPPSAPPWPPALYNAQSKTRVLRVYTQTSSRAMARATHGTRETLQLYSGHRHGTGACSHLRAPADAASNTPRLSTSPKRRSRGRRAALTCDAGWLSPAQGWGGCTLPSAPALSTGAASSAAARRYEHVGMRERATLARARWTLMRPVRRGNGGDGSGGRHACSMQPRNVAVSVPAGTSGAHKGKGLWL